MTWYIPNWSNRWRWLVIVYGLLVFIWLGLEDSNVERASFLGIGSSFLITSYIFINRFGGHRFSTITLLLSFIGIGALIGSGAALATVCLMFFKNVYHAHIYPDFPTELLADILMRSPLWAFIGALIALGSFMIKVGIRIY